MRAWILVVVAVACVASDATSIKSDCAAVDSCYEGGDMTVSCSVASGECPPCLTADDNGCYVRMDGSCSFGIDCFDAWTNSPSTSGSSGSVSSSSSTDSSTTEVPTSTSSSSQSKAGGASSGSVVADSSSDDSNTVLVVAILAVAVGIAVLAFVVRKLFLRARAASEGDQEEGIPSPPATVMTASFSSNGTALDPSLTVARSAMGTDLSVSKASTS